jgi:hypothetical protein
MKSTRMVSHPIRDTDPEGEMDALSEVVERALSYPFAVPRSSYALGTAGAVDPAPIDLDPTGRTPVLAYGSNASPAVLSSKLGAASAEGVPVMRADLFDFDVVYSAHIAAYGSIPATLRHSPGTEVPTFVAYFTDEQLRIVAATEPNYELRPIDASCRLASGEDQPGVSAFLSRHGCLLLAGSEAALAAISARGRRFPEIGQREVLERVRDALRPGLELERFVTECAAGGVRYRGLLDSAEAP